MQLFIVKNNVEDKEVFFGDEHEFNLWVRKIQAENYDLELGYLMDSTECKNYLNNYCDNLDIVLSENDIQIKDIDTEFLIGKFLSEKIGSDISIFGKIVGRKSKTILFVQRYYAVEQKTKMKYATGGFSAHCTNNYEQEWNFEILENVIEKRIRKDEFLLTNEPLHFYDYNF